MPLIKYIAICVDRDAGTFGMYPCQTPEEVVEQIHSNGNEHYVLTQESFQPATWVDVVRGFWDGGLGDRYSGFPAEVKSLLKAA